MAHRIDVNVNVFLCPFFYSFTKCHIPVVTLYLTRAQSSPYSYSALYEAGSDGYRESAQGDIIPSSQSCSPIALCASHSPCASHLPCRSCMKTTGDESGSLRRKQQNPDFSSLPIVRTTSRFHWICFTQSSAAVLPS